MLPDDSTGQGPGTFSHKTIKVQGEYGSVFAVMVQILLCITRVAPAPLLQIKSGGTGLIGAGKLSRYRILIAGRCALCPPKRSEGGCPGVKSGDIEHPCPI